VLIGTDYEALGSRVFPASSEYAILQQNHSKARPTTETFPDFVPKPLRYRNGERWAPVSGLAELLGILGEDDDMGVTFPCDPSLADLATRLAFALGRSVTGGAAWGS
jgi:hypothetical protein